VSDLKKSALRRPRVTALILGYTRTGRPVLRPTRAAPDMNTADVFDRTKEKFADWSGGEHKDAYRILQEHGEREPDDKIASWCTRWSKVHRDLGGRRPAADDN
jgi:hypothetical protein